VIKVALFDAKPYDQEYFDRYKNDFEIELKYFPVKLNPDTVALALGAQAVCAFVNDEINAKVADSIYQSGIPLIALRCAGYNNVDLQAVWGRIHVVRVPAYSPHAVAEHAVALLLALNRKIHKAYIYIGHRFLDYTTKVGSGRFFALGTSRVQFIGHLDQAPMLFID
jgi:D-lactate dehydrogenase